MLELKQIVKDYQAGDTAVHALKGVSIRFRRHEFVAVLGPSGCGKSTFLKTLNRMNDLVPGVRIARRRTFPRGTGIPTATIPSVSSFRAIT